MMGVFCMTDELVSSLPSCGEGGQLLRNGSPAPRLPWDTPEGRHVPGTTLNAFIYQLLNSTNDPGR